MNHFVVSAALASVFAFAAAIVAWLRNPSQRINRLFGLYWLSMAFWAFVVGTQFQAIKLLSPFWWGWLLHLGCTFIPLLLFHAVILLTQRNTVKFRWPIRAFYALTLLFNLLNLVTASFTSGTAYRDAYAYPRPALIYPLYFVVFVTLVIWSTVLLFQYLSRLPLPAKPGVRLLLITHTLAYIGGMDNFLIMADIRIPPLYPYGLYLIPPYALAMIYATLRYRLLATAIQPPAHQPSLQTAC